MDAWMLTATLIILLEPNNFDYFELTVLFEKRLMASD